MKITKHQLRRIIKESQFMSEPERLKRQNIFDSYEAFVKDHGHVTPSAASVVASFIFDNWREMKGSPGYLAKVMGEKYGVDQDDINLDVARQKRESMVEMKVTKRQLRRIIKEEIEKSVPFGSGMEQADLDPEQEELIGHT